MSRGGSPNYRQKQQRLRAVATEHVAGAGLYFQPIRHDDGCPSLTTQRLKDCICDPEMPPATKVRDADEWIEKAKAGGWRP